MAVVLLIEDHRETREVLREILEIAGHDVIEGADGADTLRLARAYRPDCVVTDLVLPTVDGDAAVRRLLADGDDRPRPGLVAITGERLSPARRADVDDLFDAVLEKPIEPAALVALVEAVAR